MDIQLIIAKKRDNQKLTKEEIEYFITKMTNEEIPDYQSSALIMAMYINGLEEDEIYYLTKSMAESGQQVNFNTKDIIVDKHSTGGVGDKLTLILMPIIVSLGYTVGKMSGRGLGITGGTADKLESIPGIDISLEEEQFKKQVEESKFALITQNASLAPADKKIYALRDAISCTESIPLITSSIMSKKKASGANLILLDVTYGNGAFMKTYQDAEKLKQALERVGEKLNLKTYAEITSMETPFGYSVGNSLEILETLEFLENIDKAKTNIVVYRTVLKFLKLLERNKTEKEIEEKLEDIIKNKDAYNIFLKMIKNQKGNIEEFLEKAQKYNSIQNAITIKSDFDGKIEKIEAVCVAKASFYLGSGRETKEDQIDYFAGIKLNKVEGNKISKGDILAYIFEGEKEISKKQLEKALNELKKAYVFKK